MSKRWIARLLGVSILVVVAYSGYFVGLHRGLQESYSCNLIHTQNYITALNHFHKNNVDFAVASLERDLSLGVILTPSDEAIVMPHTKEAIHKVLGEVKAYRQMYPWKSGLPNLDGRAESILSKVKASEIKPIAEECTPNPAPKLDAPAAHPLPSR